MGCVITLLVALSLSICYCQAYPQVPTQFSSDLEFVFGIGDKTVPYHGVINWDLLNKKAKISLSDTSGVTTTNLFRWDLEKQFEISEIVDCDVFPANISNGNLFSFLPKSTNKGSMMVNGEECDQYILQSTPDVALSGCIKNNTIPLKLSIRSLEYTSMSYFFTKFEEGKQDPAIFAVPDNCPQ